VISSDFNVLMVMYFWWQRHHVSQASLESLGQRMKWLGLEGDIADSISRLIRDGFLEGKSGSVLLTDKGIAEGMRFDTRAR
jgi:hypothetical protein